MKIQSRKFFPFPGFVVTFILCLFLIIYAWQEYSFSDKPTVTQLSSPQYGLFSWISLFSRWRRNRTLSINETYTSQNEDPIAKQVSISKTDSIPERLLKPRSNFSFLINEPNSCRDNGTEGTKVVEWLVVIPSIPKHSDRRHAIRRTWASQNGIGINVRIVFFFGATSDEVQQNILANESRVHRDLIQSDFHDTYKNLTLKSLEMLRWASLTCPSVKFVLKCDDDVFVRFNRLKALITPRKSDLARAVVGSVNKDGPIIRNPGSKHYVSHDDFKGTYFPPYATGGAYVIAGGILGELLRASLTTKLVSAEDVSITGLLPPKIGVKVTNLNGMHDMFDPKRAYCDYVNSLAIFNLKAEDMDRLWKTTNCTHS